MLANIRSLSALVSPALALLVCLPVFAGSLPTEDRRAPFFVGEKLVFELRWTFIPAGEAVMEVMPHESINGLPARHFRLAARSNAFVDAFYKVRDVIDAYTDMGLTRSVHYKKKQREGSTHRDVTVVFDPQNHTAQYTNGNEMRPPMVLAPGSFDPLSAFYFIRGVALKPGTALERPITDGKKNVMGRAKVVRRETIRVSGKPWDTYLIEPELQHVGGVFEKSPKAKIQLWVTADHRRLPVRIKSKVVVGSFVGDLVSAKGTSPPLTPRGGIPTAPVISCSAVKKPSTHPMAVRARTPPPEGHGLESSSKGGRPRMPPPFPATGIDSQITGRD